MLKKQVSYTLSSGEVILCIDYQREEEKHDLVDLEDDDLEEEEENLTEIEEILPEISDCFVISGFPLSVPLEERRNLHLKNIFHYILYDK